MTSTDKLIQMAIAVVLFFAVTGLILLLTARLRSRSGERVQAAAFVAPALLLIAVGLLYPAVGTIYQSFFGSSYQPILGGGNEGNFVGLDNYRRIFTERRPAPGAAEHCRCGWCSRRWWRRPSAWSTRCSSTGRASRSSPRR